MRRRPLVASGVGRCRSESAVRFSCGRVGYQIGYPQPFLAGIAASRIAPEPRWKRFASASTPAARSPISCGGAGARPVPLSQGADDHRRSGERHPRRHRRSPRPQRSRRATMSSCWCWAQRSATNAVLEGKWARTGHDHDAQVFATCSSSRASAGRIISISISRSRCRRRRATAGSKLTGASPPTAAEVAPLSEEQSRCAIAALQEKTGRGGGGLLSCTPTRIRRTKSAPAHLVQEALAGSLPLHLERRAGRIPRVRALRDGDGQREPDAGHGPLSRALRARRRRSRHQAARRASCSRTAAPCRPARCASCRSTRSSRARPAA